MRSIHVKPSQQSAAAGGTEEEYIERDQLLQGIVDLIDAAATKKKALKQVQDKRETDGHLVREAALVSLKRKAVDDEVSPLKGAEANEKRLITAVKEAASVVATFTEMMLESNKINAEEVATKKEEIMLAQQRLELERARYELDKAEREARFAVEKEREHRGKLYFMDAM
ncbi:hypothetical protein H310_13823 [Aphanomyces invadans]|uniref:Uncharacterized protein n=1 Tax=Aphanomyces invadans TaxID=157072 RepID=A0A024TC81_9STRA|nr:hypothetical protein H310_13823 [Aphanomyces invadans]ETV91765.1 hypothetical protein H310_13823 [Aphanomyces invadans]|eukprot:XP_008879691.1 hypothetical protein H310_13823 [Aphanomyces invadans]